MSTSAVLAEVNVRGVLSGHGIGTDQGTVLEAAASGMGTASRIGQFTYILQATVDLVTGDGAGAFLLAFSNGDVIYGRFVGHGDAPPPPPPTPGHIVEHLTITGGTERFQGASGSLTFDRLVDLNFDSATKLPAFDSHSGTLTGTISIPGSTD